MPAQARLGSHQSGELQLQQGSGQGGGRFPQGQTELLQAGATPESPQQPLLPRSQARRRGRAHPLSSPRSSRPKGPRAQGAEQVLRGQQRRGAHAEKAIATEGRGPTGVGGDHPEG
jgi:hypothetical protein